jgi:hypothetical protein
MSTKPNKKDGLTTEQLADALLKTIRQMTPQEKAEFRKQLKAAFRKKK